jgi:hypothetical protein
VTRVRDSTGALTFAFTSSTTFRNKSQSLLCIRYAELNMDFS